MGKLFLVHLGYYDGLSQGVFESHTNEFIVASDFEDAKSKVKQLASYKNNKMHIDGIQMIEAVCGYSIQLLLDSSLNGQSVMSNHNFRELAPKK